MSITRIDPNTRTLYAHAGTLTIRSVITTEQPDRAGDVVVPTGLRNRDDFLMNPVVLWAHNRSSVPPIGLCDWLDIQPHRIVAQTRFAEGVSFAEDVFRLYELGVLRGWSIGFIPRRFTKRALGTSQGLHISEWDLLEYSAVPIPENPGALTVALEKGQVRDQALRDWLKQVPDERAGRWITVPDVLGELVHVDVVCSE